MTELKKCITCKRPVKVTEVIRECMNKTILQLECGHELHIRRPR